MTKHLDIVGVGIGPFHLSLAALLSKNKKVSARFFDQKAQFEWHPELMFSDADMQTSYLKDLVTPIDPTSPHSFLNYLVQHGYFYSFMNTGRKVVTRREFELYCQWVAKNLSQDLSFGASVDSVDYDGEKFHIKTKKEEFTSSHLSVATGLVPRIPECARPHLGAQVFHAKSSELKNVDFTQKRVLIVGGGQTGVEIFRNALKKKWGEAKSIRLVSRRQNLEPLDESPFTNEYFHPNYVREFFPISEEQKGPILMAQKLASDGNTPAYLEALYNELYHIQNVEKSSLDIKILPKRSLIDIQKTDSGYKAGFENAFLNEREEMHADIIILSTGFVMGVPKFLEPLRSHMHLDQEGRFILNQQFDLHWKGAPKNKIYALNFSRHRHGISEPQTSLMAWRSATIINHLLNEDFYKINHYAPSFVQYGKDETHETRTDSISSYNSRSR